MAFAALSVLLAAATAQTQGDVLPAGGGEKFCP
jgi:hypothetical protein